jgi:hypothetical protein
VQANNTSVHKIDCFYFTVFTINPKQKMNVQLGS